MPIRFILHEKLTISFCGLTILYTHEVIDYIFLYTHIFERSSLTFGCYFYSFVTTNVVDRNCSCPTVSITALNEITRDSYWISPSEPIFYYKRYIFFCFHLSLAFEHLRFTHRQHRQSQFKRHQQQSREIHQLEQHLINSISVTTVILSTASSQRNSTKLQRFTARKPSPRINSKYTNCN